MSLDHFNEWINKLKTTRQHTHINRVFKLSTQIWRHQSILFNNGCGPNQLDIGLSQLGVTLARCRLDLGSGLLSSTWARVHSACLWLGLTLLDFCLGRLGSTLTRTDSAQLWPGPTRLDFGPNRLDFGPNQIDSTLAHTKSARL